MCSKIAYATFLPKKLVSSLKIVYLWSVTNKLLGDVSFYVRVP